MGRRSQKPRARQASRAIEPTPPATSAGLRSRGAALDWSARISVASCLVSIVFGTITIVQTVHRASKDDASAQAAAQSVALARVADFAVVHQYVLQTRMGISAALHKPDFKEAIDSGLLDMAMTANASPALEMTLDEMHAIGKASPQVETAVAQCKEVIRGMNLAKAQTLDTLRRPPDDADPDRSLAQMEVGFTMKLLPAVSQTCDRATEALRSIAAPDQIGAGVGDRLGDRLLEELAKGERVKLLEEPTGRYRFGPVLKHLASGAEPQGAGP